MSNIFRGGQSVALIADRRPSDPARIGPYRVVGVLGAGGMGTVYAALGARGERVAVKVVHTAQATDEQFRARFRREVQVLQRVQGPCLVPLLEADPSARTPWLATPYVPGLTLGQSITGHGPLAGIGLYLLAAGTAQALTSVHAAGVVHRDLKPANVILAPDGPRVLDFGIAHVADGTAVTRTGLLTGTPGWISPEYYRDGTSGPPGDVFAWGALIAFAATGRHPFGTGNAEAVAYRVMSGEPDLRGVPDALRGVVESCLAKDPAHRPPAAAVAELLAELVAEQATQVLGGLHDRPTEVQQLIAEQWHAPTVEDPAWTTVATRRHSGRTALAVGAAAAVVAAVAVGIWAALAPTVPHSRASSQNPPRSAPALAATPAQSPPVATPRAVQAAQTQVNTISPWNPDGTPAGGITVTAHASGSCFGAAESTMRTDAWRCSYGNQIVDPCFSPDSNPQDTTVLCLDNSPVRMIELSVPQGLPVNNTTGNPDIEPIIIVLANGAHCSFAGGATSTLAGERLNYGCTNGGNLYGFPNKQAAAWTISYSAPNSGVSVSTPIAMVYQ